jgi:hypothetical protein
MRDTCNHINVAGVLLMHGVEPLGTMCHERTPSEEPARNPTMTAQYRPATVPPRLRSVRRAADYLSLSTWTVRELAAPGILPRIRLPVRKALLASPT